MYTSSNLVINNFTINSDNLEINVIDLNTKFLNLTGDNGRIQLNYLKLSKSAFLKLNKGDIIVQTDYNY